MYIYIYIYIYIYKTACNLFQDSPHPDLASLGNQSVKLRCKSSRITGRFPQNARH